MGVTILCDTNEDKQIKSVSKLLVTDRIAVGQ